MTRARLLALGLALLLLGGLLRWPSLDLPLDRDEGEYATLAWLWSDGHGLPYRDWLQQKPPASLGVNALAQAAFSDGVRGLRWVALLWTAATVLALALLLLQLLRSGGLWGPRARAAGALLAGLLAALLLSSSRTQSLSANTEAWLSLPLIAALSLAFGGAGPGRWALSGAFIGVASLFKQPALAALPLFAWAAQPTLGRRWAALGWSAAGAALPWALLLAAFAAQGGGRAFLDCTWAYNQGYVLSGLGRSGGAAAGLALRLAPELGAVAVLAALGAWSLGPGPLRRALLAWLGVGLALLLSGGRYYPHYAIGLLAPLAALAGLALAAPQSPLSRGLRLGLAALAVGGWIHANAGLWTARSGGARSLHIYGLSEFAASPEAARRIQALCPPDRALFVWGDEAQLYYLSRRVPASRFLYSYPFTGEAPAWPDGERQLWEALRSPAVGAVVLAKPLDPADPLQLKIQGHLEARFVPDRSAPPFILGTPRP